MDQHRFEHRYSITPRNGVRPQGNIVDGGMDTARSKTPDLLLAFVRPKACPRHRQDHHRRYAVLKPLRLPLWTEARLRVAAWFARPYGRHGAPDKTVADYETEHGGPWRAGEVKHLGADDEYVELLEALVEDLHAEESGEREPLPLTGELTEQEKTATVAAIQGKTMEVPVIDSFTLLERDTQRWFDEAFKGVVEQFDDEFAMVLAALVDDEETQTALMRLARTHRDEMAKTIEMPVVAAA